MKYAKFIVAAAGAVLAALTTALSDDSISQAEILTIATAVITALGVYLVPNKDTP